MPRRRWKVTSSYYRGTRPFFFPLDIAFSRFCDRFSDKDKLKALSTADGFEALVISLKDRKKDFTIEVHMPAPRLLAADLPYETDDYNPPDALRAGPLVGAPADCKSLSVSFDATLDVSAAPVMEDLREKYPVGNHPSFPNKRIVTDPKLPDRHWELTDIRIRVWAAHIVVILSLFRKCS
ncbi:hypothetical protein B0H13DRAFT_1855083 [Mycena leptocephala]|nr:hypothetical protein B0H13DRAFT_1855083 [Mycena leptocephala]